MFTLKKVILHITKHLLGIMPILHIMGRYHDNHLTMCNVNITLISECKGNKEP